MAGAVPNPHPAPRTGDAWWAYGVLSAADAEQLPTDLAGLEPGAPVELIREGELAALVSRVPLAEYGDERLREHLNDIAWVERTARTHEAVLERVMEVGSVIPLRLCTLYLDREGVRRLLREEREALTGSLAAIAGHEEWGLKVFAVRERLAEAIASAEPEPEAAGSEGTGYLERRRRERDLDRRVEESGTRGAEAIHTKLEGCADAARVNPVQRPEAHGRDGEMLLNGVYLVSRERRVELDEIVRALRDEWEPAGFALELTGPWPPYNFVSTSTVVAG